MLAEKLESVLYVALIDFAPVLENVNEQLPVPVPAPGPVAGVSAAVQEEPLPVTVTVPVGPDNALIKAGFEETLKLTGTGWPTTQKPTAGTVIEIAVVVPSLVAVVACVTVFAE